MSNLFQTTAEDYLEMIGDWVDPNPDPVIEEHNGFLVVRDDLLGGGSKIRFADYLIKSNKEIQEWVYGSSPATGYAQISLSCLCRKYGKESVIFMAERAWDKLHNYQLRALEEGANMKWVPNGMLSVTEKRARDYVAEDPKTRRLLPIGFDDDTVVSSIISVCRSLPVDPTEVWTVGSSGTLTRGLQLAWPNAKFHCVRVGHSGSYGEAKIYKSEYAFNKPTKVLPPFPSAPTYDAKAWEFMLDHASPGALFWNVGS
jgi:cysteine synthase